MLDTVLFDLDGVLFEGHKYHAWAFCQALRDVAFFHLPLEEHNRRFEGVTSDFKLKALVEEGRVREHEIPEIKRQKNGIILHMVNEDDIFDLSKVELFENLKQEGYTFGVVSNAQRVLVDLVLEKMDLTRLLTPQYVITQSEVRFPKPNPQPYALAMSRMTREGNRVLVLEDSEAGINSAITAGAHKVYKVSAPHTVTWGLVKGLLCE